MSIKKSIGTSAEPLLNVAVLISGRGSNFIALHQALHRRSIPARICCVISSKAQAGGLTYAREHNVPVHVLSQQALREEARLAEELLDCLNRHQADLVVLAGFLKKVPPAVVSAYEHRMINIHPALLPAFGGKGMYGRHVHEAVLAYGCKVSGATVHLVTNEYDAGAPILQQCVPVLDDDTPETLAARVLEVEHQLLPKAVELFARGRIVIKGRNVRIQPMDQS